MNALLTAIILTLLPITELRAGLPVALVYASNNGIPTFPIFLLILILNLLLVFLIFFFLDKVHHLLLNLKFYKKIFSHSVKILQRKANRFETRHEKIGFLALVLLVAIPLPLTGAYSGVLISWLLGLDRKKSIYSIFIGIILAGIIIYLGTMGILSL